MASEGKLQSKRSIHWRKGQSEANSRFREIPTPTQHTQRPKKKERKQKEAVLIVNMITNSKVDTRESLVVQAGNKRNRRVFENFTTCAEGQKETKGKITLRLLVTKTKAPKLKGEDR